MSPNVLRPLQVETKGVQGQSQVAQNKLSCPGICPSLELLPLDLVPVITHRKGGWRILSTFSDSTLNTPLKASFDTGTGSRWTGEIRKRTRRMILRRSQMPSSCGSCTISENLIQIPKTSISKYKVLAIEIHACSSKELCEYLG